MTQLLRYSPYLRHPKDDGGKKGSKKGSKGSKPYWYGDKDKGSTGNKAEARARAKPDIATISESKNISESTVHTRINS